MEAIADTSFVVAILNRHETVHEKAVHIFKQYHVIGLPQTVLAEVCYMIGARVGVKAVISFLRNIPNSRFVLQPIDVQDVNAISLLLEQYADSRIDFVDASVMVLAEKHNVATILTLDQRDFSLVKSNKFAYFQLLP